MKQTIIFAFSTIIAVGILAGTVFFAIFTFQPMLKQALKQNAIDECSRNSKYIYDRPTEGIRTEEPIKANYEKCLKDKGY